MSNVTLAIGGRNFTVSAADGEESHIEMLGRMIDERVRRLGNFAGQSEARMVLFGALVMADELHEAHRNLPAPGPGADPQAQADASAALAARLAALADRIEKLATHLE